MSYLGIVTLVGQQKIAASIGGTPLNLTTIRVGDGNGAPITPNETMTDLVRRVGTGYAITSAGPDATDPNIWRVTTIIDENQGPFDVREIAVFDATGAMIAIASHPLVEKRSTAQGAAVALTTDIIFAVSETAQVNVTLSQANAASIADMLRVPFLVVNSATVVAPPASPALGDTYVVPTGATGAWSGYVGYLVQWNGTVWVAVNPPTGHLVVAQDKGTATPDRYLTKTATGWVPELPLAVQGGSWSYAAASGTVNALAVTLAPVPSAYTEGMAIRVKVTAPNTGPATINVNGLGAKNIVRPGGIALSPGDLALGVSELVYNGTAFQISGGLGSTAGSTGFRFAQSFAASGVFTVPVGIFRVYARVWAAGGAGAAGSPSQGGGGGGGGGYSEGFFDVTPGQNIAVTVGAGGTGAGSSSGSAGGSSSFGPFCSATGGGGGSFAGPNFTGGVSGLGAGGHLQVTGGNGGAGTTLTGGAGGSGGFGGGNANVSMGLGSNGNGPGGGGSGYGPASGSAGQTGASGLVLVIY